MNGRAPRPLRGPAFVALVVAALALAVGAWAATTYNRLVQARQAVNTQWAQVEVQYQRRVDLVPALVAALRGYLAQERTVLDAVARARAAYLATPAGTPDRVRAAEALQQPLGRLVAVVEASPVLRSNDTVAGLMDELAGTENRIAVERRRYNDRVLTYDTLVLKVPSSLIAAARGFRPRPYFEAAPGAGSPPSVTLPSR
ncbi:MAG TPA: LemA family protein [bacterium]|nr:LemA family protein [bacterium]